MSALLKRVSTIISLLPAANYSANEGYLVTSDGTTATLLTSATTRPNGVILEPGRDATSHITVGLLGAFEGTVFMKCGGAIAGGAWVQANSDGSVLTDAGPGNARIIVGQALEAGVLGDLIEIAPVTPLTLS